MPDHRAVPDATARQAPLVGNLEVIPIADGVVSVVGELDAATAPRLHRSLDQDRSVRVIDMHGVSFIDAGGLAPILAARRTQPIVLRAPSGCVVRLLQLTALSGHVAIED